MVLALVCGPTRLCDPWEATNFNEIMFSGDAQVSIS
jgi:hypothetical protein